MKCDTFSLQIAPQLTTKNDSGMLLSQGPTDRRQSLLLLKLHSLLLLHIKSVVTKYIPSILVRTSERGKCCQIHPAFSPWFSVYIPVSVPPFLVVQSKCQRITDGELRSHGYGDEDYRQPATLSEKQFWLLQTTHRPTLRRGRKKHRGQREFPRWIGYLPGSEALPQKLGHVIWLWHVNQLPRVIS